MINNLHEDLKAVLKSAAFINMTENRATVDEHSYVPMKGFDDKWIKIQKNTFTNWINEQLKRDSTIIEPLNDLQTDLCDGVKLVHLVNILQQPNPKIPKRFFKKPINQHQRLENVTLALNAITEDGIKLVNIGNTDIADGNPKLILGLVWHLILRYQIGKTKIPPKKLILAWLKAVLPECHITNLTSDLNDGIVLGGLINYCNDNLCTDWRTWNKMNKLENCRTAMHTAQSALHIPLVVTPENMCSPELDELSAITYMSYFMKEGSPGYLATLKIIQMILEDEKITNFTTDWNDGWLLCKIAQKMGATIKGFPNLDRTKKEQNCQLGIDGCRQLRVDPYITPKELADPEVDSIGIMATLAQFKYTKPIKKANEKAKVNLGNLKNATVGKPIEFSIEYFDNEIKNIKPNVRGPNSTPSVGTEKSVKGLNCYFTPGESGIHELTVKCDDHVLDGCPFIIDVKADTSKVKLVTTSNYAALNEPIEICVNPMGAGKGRVVVNTRSPSNNEFSCPVEERDSKYFAKISPTEVGQWTTHVFYDNEEVSGSPYILEAFNPRLTDIILPKELNRSSHLIHKQITFEVDASAAGNGTVTAEVLLNNRSIPVNVRKVQNDPLNRQNLYEIYFTPVQIGLYHCSILFNNKQVKGSPIDFNVMAEGTQINVNFEKCKSVQANQNCVFTVETKDGGSGDLRVVITNPIGGHIQAKITNNQNGTWRVEFRPIEVGEYYVDVFYVNQLVNGSPFKCSVFDPTKIVLTPCLFGLVDKIVNFEVDASQAGTGQLEIAVENGRVPCNFKSQGNLRFIPAFTPREPGKHHINVKFNGIEVPGSPFICDVSDLHKISLVNQNRLLRFPINRNASIEFNVNDTLSHSLNISLTSPSGKNLHVTQSVSYNIMKVSFTGSEVGSYRLDMDYTDIPIPGSPFEIKIYDSTKIIVTDPKGLEVNKMTEFTIDASHAGEGQLEISINDGTIKNHVKQIKQGQYSVTFIPTKQDYYYIDCKFNGEIVPGCPKKIYAKDAQNVKVVGMPSEHAIFGGPYSFQISSVTNINNLDVKIKSPSGEVTVPKIQKIGDEEYKLEWTPLQLGTYYINIQYGDTPVKGTPLKIKVYDPKRVQIYNVQDSCVFKPTTFCVDASLAGEGQLEIGISCNNHFIPNQVKPLGNSKFEVHFLPQESVIHYANINFNGEPINGSPFPIKIIDTNLVVAQGKAFGYIPINSISSFHVFTNGAGAGQVRATITGW